MIALAQVRELKKNDLCLQEARRGRRLTDRCFDRSGKSNWQPCPKDETLKAAIATLSVALELRVRCSEPRGGCATAQRSGRQRPCRYHAGFIITLTRSETVGGQRRYTGVAPPWTYDTRQQEGRRSSGPK